MSPQELTSKITTLQEQINNSQGTECKVYSRCVGYHSDTSAWNKGKKEEFITRNIFNVAR